jgi:DnaJ-class molecular chaperone
MLEIPITPAAEPDAESETTLCPGCNGTGLVGDRPCPTCEGSGRIVEPVGED